MTSVSEWRIPKSAQPNPKDYGFDLEAALSAVVALRSIIPPDAFTADILGTERAGYGALIRKDGLVLTIGYLITEAETIWVNLSDGRVLPGHSLGFDSETGFGLVQILERVNLPVLPLGDSHACELGSRVIVAGAGGRERSVAARIMAKQEFAGYWEYVLDEAIFTAPAHPHWGGTAVIGPSGDLIGIGSLQLEGAKAKGSQFLNMIVPTDLLKPILGDMLKLGRPDRPVRPWLGLYAAEVEDKVVIIGLATEGPAALAEMQTGDIIVSVGETRVDDLGSMFRAIWAFGPAGVTVPLTIWREGRTLEIHVKSADRNAFLKRPRAH